MNDKKLFGSNLRKLRQEKKLSEALLPARIGMSKQYYLRLEKGQFLPTVDTAFRLADALGVKVADLFADNVKQNERRKAI